MKHHMKSSEVRGSRLEAYREIDNGQLTIAGEMNDEEL